VEKGGKMAKKQLGRTEAQFNKFIQDPANKLLLQPVLARHPGADLEQNLLFEAIGEDLDSEQETVRETAFWSAKALLPGLDEILHVQRNSQKNIIDQLRQVLVTERRFSQRRGKDPRPFVEKIADNWDKDGQKRESRLLSLDRPLGAGDEKTSIYALLPSPTAVEDEVVGKLLLEQFFAALDFLTKNEKFVLEADLAKWPTEEIADELGKTPNAVCHIRSRAKGKIKAHREELRQKFLDLTLLDNARLASLLGHFALSFYTWLYTVDKKDRYTSFAQRAWARIRGLRHVLDRLLARLRIKRLGE
jgi:DNA-directed RNA polymerase specialized sigma24 family protein